MSYKFLRPCRCRENHPGAGERIHLLGSEYHLVNLLSKPKQLENRILFLRPFHHLSLVQTPLGTQHDHCSRSLRMLCASYIPPGPFHVLP